MAYRITFSKKIDKKDYPETSIHGKDYIDIRCDDDKIFIGSKVGQVVVFIHGRCIVYNDVINIWLC